MNQNTNSHIHFRRYQPEDLESLMVYFQKLDTATLSMFQPHPFDKDSVIQILKNDLNYNAFIALDDNENVIAYFILKNGFVDHDKSRINASLNESMHHKACTLAPSVLPLWQNSGIGTSLFYFVADKLVENGFEMILLWGGVSASNKRAMHFYDKIGFQVIGEFEHNGKNFDMVFMLKGDLP